MAMALTFNRNFDAAYGQAVAVAPLTKRIVCANPGPFTFAGTNSYLVGEDRVAIIDPGPADPGHMAAIEAAVGARTVVAILVTHTHADHSPGARILRERTGAPIAGAGIHRPARKGGATAAGADGSVDRDHRPDTALADGERITGDGWALAAVATPGHTANHLAFALEAGSTEAGDGVLFSGDHVMGWSTSVVAPPDGRMADYMASLDKLAGRADHLHLPGHGPAIRDPRTHVSALIGHRRAREQAIVECVRAGIADIDAIVSTLYAGLDHRLEPAAALSVLAHLQDLAARGIVVTAGPPGLASRYEPASWAPD